MLRVQMSLSTYCGRYSHGVCVDLVTFVYVTFGTLPSEGKVFRISMCQYTAQSMEPPCLTWAMESLFPHHGSKMAVPSQSHPGTRSVSRSRICRPQVMFFTVEREYL